MKKLSSINYAKSLRKQSLFTTRTANRFHRQRPVAITPTKCKTSHNNTLQGTRISDLHLFRQRTSRALERERYAAKSASEMEI